MLALEAGPGTAYPATAGDEGFFNLSFFGESFFTLATKPSEPLELQPASHTCPECLDYSKDPDYSTYSTLKTWPYKLVTPIPKSDPEQGWILYPCHETECALCYNAPHVYNICDICDRCEECCNHPTCQSCETKVESTCDHDNYCNDCCALYHVDDDDDDNESYYGHIVPGWIERGITPPACDSDSYRDVLHKVGCFDIDPVTEMATFYLLDYIYATSFTTPELADFAKQAQALQAQQVLKLDAAFREYLFMAIGGELRHHSAVQLTSSTNSRSKSWGAWLKMSEECGRPQLLEDAIELFQTDAWPSSGYGGEAWANVARILQMRESNKLDARTFVDRVFSLQHNSGSVLDKVYWAADDNGKPGTAPNPMAWYAEGCKFVGNAHAARQTDLTLLLTLATPEVARLYRQRHLQANKALRHTGAPLQLQTRPYILPEEDKYRYNGRRSKLTQCYAYLDRYLRGHPDSDRTIDHYLERYASGAEDLWIS